MAYNSTGGNADGGNNKYVTFGNTDKKQKSTATEVIENANLLRPQLEGAFNKTDPAIIAARKRLAEGLTGEEMQAARDVATQGIGQSTQQQSRAMQALQQQLGVRGATAATQQMQVLGQGAERQADFERDLLLQNRQAQMQGLAGLEQSQAFDISQAAKEKLMPIELSTGFKALDVAELQGQSSGGGGTIICTELNRQKLLSDELRKLSQDNGSLIIANEKIVYDTYIKLATPVVKLMQLSKTFSKIIQILFIPGIKYGASLVDNNIKYNIFGKLTYKIGYKLLKIIGGVING